MKIKNIKKYILIFLITFTFTVFVSVLQANWQGPSDNPPDGNISETLNISTNEQTKTGTMFFNSNVVVNNLQSNRVTILNGNIGIGTINPTAKMHLYGGNGIVSDGTAIMKADNFCLNDGSKCLTDIGNRNLAPLEYVYCRPTASMAYGCLDFCTEGRKAISSGFRIIPNPDKYSTMVYNASASYFDWDYEPYEGRGFMVDVVPKNPDNIVPLSGYLFEGVIICK